MKAILLLCVLKYSTVDTISRHTMTLLVNSMEFFFCCFHCCAKKDSIEYGERIIKPSEDIMRSTFSVTGSCNGIDSNDSDSKENQSSRECKSVGLSKLNRIGSLKVVRFSL